MKITTLSENTTRGGLKSEHGLSLYVEMQDKKILFDFGASSLFCENALMLGVDLRGVDFAVLSHGHNDHGGGLKRFLEINKRAPVYVSPHAFEPHYNAVDEYIGLDQDFANNDRLILVEKSKIIDTGVEIFNCNHLSHRFPITECGHTKEVNGERQKEDYCHEQYLLITEGEKRVLFSGCSHKGILNIMEWAKPTHLIGGFHFSKLPLDNTLLSYAQQLDHFGAQYYTCHCTGTEQFEFMKNRMQNLNYLATGDEITI